MCDELSFDELTNITNQVKEERKLHLNERIAIARRVAIEHITINCYDKMKISASSGKDFSDIYSFNWTKNKTDAFDKDNNQIIFEGDIHLLDLIKKDSLFFEDLSKFFNKKDNDKFFCGYRRETIDETSRWYIFVSWNEIKKEIYKTKYTDKKADGRTDRHSDGRTDRHIDRNLEKYNKTNVHKSKNLKEKI